MNYKEVIEAKYSREAWQGLLYDIFHNKVKFWRTPTPIHVSSRLAKEALSLGNISLSDGETIAVYEVELNENLLQTGAIWAMLVHSFLATGKTKVYSASHM